jgi:hypothetical protein
MIFLWDGTHGGLKFFIIERKIKRKVLVKISLVDNETKDQL